MSKVQAYVALIDLVGWTKFFIDSQDDAITQLTNFQRHARSKLEGEEHLSYVVTFADNVWVRRIPIPHNNQILSEFLNRILEVVEYANRENLNPWCVVTSGWMSFDNYAQTLVSGGNITDLHSQHIAGIGEAQVRVACAEKTRKLDAGVLWVEKELIKDILSVYTAKKEVNLIGLDKWPFSHRNDFVAIDK